jgi:hypothetical protein
MAGCRSLSAECGVLGQLSTGATLHQQPGRNREPCSAQIARVPTRWRLTRDGPQSCTFADQALLHLVDERFFPDGPHVDSLL